MKPLRPCQLLIDYLPGEWRACVMCEDRLIDLMIQRPFDQDVTAAQRGDIYLGQVRKINPAIGAAFVEIGEGADGFLPLKDSQNSPLTEGQKQLFFIKQPARGSKGPVLSLHPELQSADLVFTPTKGGINLSKNLNDPEKIKTALQTVVPAKSGFVVRSSAQHARLEDLKAQAQNLLDQFHQITAKAQDRIGKYHQHQNFKADITQWIDQYDIKKIIIDHPDLQKHLPADVPCEMWHQTSGLFEAHHMEEQIETLMQPIVALPKGGNISIERSRALISVDVDWANRTDRAKTPQTLYDFNLEALTTFKEQMHLRKLGGQIVIDFLKLDHPQKRKALNHALKEAFINQDHIHVFGLSPMGLGEISALRTQRSLDQILSDPASAFYKIARALKSRPQLIPTPLPAALWALKEAPGLVETRHWLESRSQIHPLFIPEAPHAQ